MSDILSVRDLTKIYPGKNTYLAVDGISFDLKEGEILGLLGPNGSGKTTTIQMLLGTLTISSGSVLYFGKDFIKHQGEILQSVAFASTYLSLPYILTVEENLSVYGLLYGFSKQESKRRYLPLLERFGIAKYLKSRVSFLSAGQITRLMIVKAFFIQPKVVLLDEPTASLDPDISKDICDFLLEEREKTGLSILFTSHKMEEVAQVCDRVIFLDHGKIIANDIPERLAKQNAFFRLRLTILENLQKAIDLAREKNYTFTSDHRSIELEMKEVDIPFYLYELSKAEIMYSGIHIEEPSLEHYFLKIARRGRVDTKPNK